MEFDDLNPEQARLVLHKAKAKERRGEIDFAHVVIRYLEDTYEIVRRSEAD